MQVIDHDRARIGFGSALGKSVSVGKADAVLGGEHPLSADSGLPNVPLWRSGDPIDFRLAGTGIKQIG